MPRRNALLKYLKAGRQGKLTYIRQIPIKLRPYLGNKATIRRTLLVESTDCSNPAVLAAYTAVHTEVEALIQGAEAAEQRVTALIPVQSTAITANPGRFPLTKREVAGIAGQVLLDIRDAVENQRLCTRAFTECLVALAFKFKNHGVNGVSSADFAGLAKPTLDSLGIQPTSADLKAIGEALLGYIPVMEADMEKLQRMDFSPPQLQEITPPLPKTAVSWDQMLSAWVRSTGGVLEKDGYGVSKTRHQRYDVAIREIQEVIPGITPAQVDIEVARAYVTWLQDKSGLAIGSCQGRLTCFRYLFKIGKADGLVTENPFEDLRIKTPAGAKDALTYQSFTKQELIKIFTHLKQRCSQQDQLMCWIALTTGCRIREFLQLRTFDLQQTEAGVWFFDWKHEPLAELPILLKSKDKNNRQCPVHPRLIAEGLLDLPRDKTGRLFPKARSATSTAHWFADVLQKLKLYQMRKKSMHSFRNCAKDLWREAGIPMDVRSALTGHTISAVGESEYGVGLAQMPDALYKEVVKVDLSWLP